MFVKNLIAPPMASNDTGTDELKRDIDRVLFSQAEIILRLENPQSTERPTKAHIVAKYRQLREDYDGRFSEEPPVDYHLRQL